MEVNPIKVPREDPCRAKTRTMKRLVTHEDPQTPMDRRFTWPRVKLRLNAQKWKCFGFEKTARFRLPPRIKSDIVLDLEYTRI